MAPEIIDNSGYNEKVDVWAAGILMYNMLTGVDPFSAEDDIDYKDNIKFKEINFDYIKNEQLRELNKKLLNRYVTNRISAKEALNEIKKIKIEKAENNIKNNEHNWNKIAQEYNISKERLLNLKSLIESYPSNSKLHKKTLDNFILSF